MGEWKISPRLGIEVYLTEGDQIAIEQSDPMDSNAIIVVHPDEVDRLIEYLREAKQAVAGISGKSRGQ